MAEVTCPTCATIIDTEERCPSERGMGRCMEMAGHDGYHWSDMGSKDNVLIWTGVYHARSCPGRLDLTRWCQKAPGHDGPHNDGGGMSFSLEPIEEDERV